MEIRVEKDEYDFFIHYQKLVEMGDFYEIVCVVYCFQHLLEVEIMNVKRSKIIEILLIWVKLMEHVMLVIVIKFDLARDIKAYFWAL